MPYLRSLAKPKQARNFKDIKGLKCRYTFGIRAGNVSRLNISMYNSICRKLSNRQLESVCPLNDIGNFSGDICGTSHRQWALSNQFRESAAFVIFRRREKVAVRFTNFNKSVNTRIGQAEVALQRCSLP